MYWKEKKANLHFSTRRCEAIKTLCSEKLSMPYLNLCEEAFSH